MLVVIAIGTPAATSLMCSLVTLPAQFAVKVLVVTRRTRDVATGEMCNDYND